MRKRRKRAIIKSICKQFNTNVDTDGFYMYLLSNIDEFKKKYK